MKYLDEVKVGDVIWAIDDSNEPTIMSWTVKSIIELNGNLKRYYKIEIITQENEIKSFYLDDYNDGKTDLKDYDKSHIIEDNHSENITYYKICFDKNELINDYIKELNDYIRHIEVVIDMSKNQLEELNKKFKYIQLQYDSI